MATSGTTAFDLSIDRLIERAYARCGTQIRTGYELSAAWDNLNLLFSEWGNRGIHLWKIKNHTQNLTAGQTEYTAPSDASDILEVVFRSSDGLTDTTMTKIIIPGDFDMTPGKIISMEVPIQADISLELIEGKPFLDTFMSGHYLVSTIIHNFSERDGYTMKLSLKKDSFIAQHQLNKEQKESV